MFLLVVFVILIMMQLNKDIQADIYSTLRTILNWTSITRMAKGNRNNLIWVIRVSSYYIWGEDQKQIWLKRFYILALMQSF